MCLVEPLALLLCSVLGSSRQHPKHREVVDVSPRTNLSAWINWELELHKF